jgi:DNA recombination protein RmuC
VVGELKALAEQQGGAAEALRQTVEGRLDKLRQENSDKLDEMRKTVDEKLQSELEKRLGESFRTVSEQLERVHKGLGDMQSLATGVGDLKKVLSNVKTRGILGEAQLGMLLDQFLSPAQYLANAQIKPGAFVEFAIRLPGDGADVLMPIDAKFPSEDYERLVEAADRADADGVAMAAAALEARVKNFAKTIHDKYINPPATTDYAILFLPTEGLFAEVVRRAGLIEAIQRDFQVTVAGPTTLTALLSAFQMGFRALALQQRSGEVWKVLGAVRSEFSKHGEVVERLKKQLGAAANTIDALDTRTNQMNRRLRDVEALPASEAQEVLGLPSPDGEL